MAKRKRPAVRCSWSNRCKRRPTVFVDVSVEESVVETPLRSIGAILHSPVSTVTAAERYCKTHATIVADTLVGNFVKARDGWACVHCGRTDSPQWAHIISRGARYIRYNPENSVCLAAACHQMFTLKPAAWAVFVEDRWPGRWTRLIHDEIDGERNGGHVDIAAIIEVYRGVAA